MSTVTETSTTEPGVQPAPGARTPMTKSVLMCRPEHFTVAYQINPWMDPAKPTDTALAVAQWQALYDAYVGLGFDVHLIDPIEGLPDMVYAANGGTVIDGIAYGAKFTHEQRAAEGPAYMEWFRTAGFDVREPEATNEGEGDFLLVGDVILAGTGFRSDTASHDELRRITGREVVTLNLVNPSFYHLDTAIAVLDSRPGQEHIAYLPSAFDEPSLVLWRDGDGPLDREDATDVLSGALAAPAATTGVHVCGPGPVRIALDAGPDVVGVDVGTVALEDAHGIARFLDGGGWIAWGAVPTDRPIGESSQALWRELVDLHDHLQITVILFGPQFAARDQETGRRWVLAYLRGVRDYNDAVQRVPDIAVARAFAFKTGEFYQAETAHRAAVAVNMP